MPKSLTELLFGPSSIVVYGASADPDKLSGRPVDYLRRFGYPGAIYAINPRCREVQGVPAVAAIEEISGPIDLAVVVLPAEKVLDALARCAAHGVGAAIVFASGFVEAGAGGEELQDRLTALARESGMRIIGPNCLGAFSFAERSFATFSTAFDDDAERADSPVALVSQSGAVGTFAYSAMNSEGVGVRYFANTGNQVDVTVLEVLEALVAEPNVTTLVGHVEDGRDIDGLAQLADTAAGRGKNLVLLKGGRTVAGARAVRAHTGSIAGDAERLEATVAARGGIVVHGLEDMTDTVLALQQGRVPAGPRLTLVTLSGGCAALAADAATEAGLVVDTWQSTDREVVARRLPYFASTLNPIDLTGAMLTDGDSLVATLEIVGHNDETDVICVVLGNADRNAGAAVEALTQASRATAKPFVVSWTGGSGRPRQELLRRGVPTFTDPGRAVRALGRLAAAAESRRAGAADGSPVVESALALD